MLTTVTADGRTFDRFKSRDTRRENWPAEDVVEFVAEPFPKSWYSRLVTDQGREGACVGHGLTTELVASPRPATLVTADQASVFAQRLYKRAQQLDPWAGEAYSGTSVDAGFKAVREYGWISEWRWMWDIKVIRNAVMTEGPVVLGVDWYEEMYTTRPSGLVKIGGAKVGGHCITIIGYHPGMRIAGEDWNARYEVFKWKNSWGTDYGKNGVGYILANDLATLMNDGGEAAIAMGRKKVNIVGAMALDDFRQSELVGA